MQRGPKAGEEDLATPQQKCSLSLLQLGQQWDGSPNSEQLFIAPSAAPKAQPFCAVSARSIYFHAGSSVEESEPRQRCRRTGYSAKQTQRRVEPQKRRNKVGVLTGPPPRLSWGRPSGWCRGRRAAMQAGGLGHRAPEGPARHREFRTIYQLFCLTRALSSAMGKWQKEGKKENDHLEKKGRRLFMSVQIAVK